LLLLSAQAGSGKTTAVLEWVGHATHDLVGQVAWLSLDKLDNEPVRFWNYVCQTLEKALPELAGSLSNLFNTYQSHTIEHILTSLINALTQLNQVVTLVLDDYHLLSVAEIHEQMTFLLDHLPPQLHLVITSRIDPALPLARLRMRRQLAEIRASDLRFNQAEAGDFLSEVSGQTLASHHIATLEDKTEGWIAALQLAALLLQNNQDTNRLVQNFSGSQRFMLDFLAEEVLQTQTPTIQNFLLQTSVLGQLNAALVEEITGCADGQAMLQSLLEANLFLIPLDDQHYWYRYHHLFQQYLQNRLTQTQPAHVPMLHGWAARWYASHDLPFEAIEHALKAEDFLYAAELIDTSTRQMYQRQELRTLWRWLKAIPTHIIEQHPHTGLNCAWTLILQHQYEAAWPYVEIMQNLLARPDLPTKFPTMLIKAWRGELLAVQANLEKNQGNFTASLDLASQALLLIAPPQTFLRCAILVNRGQCYIAINDLNAAIQEFIQTESLARGSGDSYFMLLGMVAQAQLQAQQGHLGLAQATCQRAFSTNQATTLPILGIAYLVMGQLHYERNAPSLAMTNLQQAYTLLEPIGDLNLVAIYILQSSYWLAQANFEAAWQQLDMAGQLLFHSEHQSWSYQLGQARVRYWLALSVATPITKDGTAKYISEEVALAMTQVVAWSANCDLHNALIPPALREVDLLLLARLQLYKQQPEPAEAYRLAATVVTTTVHLSVKLEGLLLQVRSLRMQGQIEAALSILEQAVQLAQPEGFVRIFLEEGAAILELLPKLKPALATFVAPALAEPVSSTLILTTPAEVVTIDPIPRQSKQHPVVLVEPLTEREQEVLYLLVTTTLDSNGIAAQLSVAVSTLRTHIKNIYGKLAVQSRLQAIIRARELNLVSEA
jgi:LuxR family maltose regulon positive regulatory protein